MIRFQPKDTKTREHRLKQALKAAKGHAARYPKPVTLAGKPKEPVK